MKNRKSVWKQMAVITGVLLASGGLGYFCGWFLGNYINESGRNWYVVYLFLLTSIFAANYFHIFIHEGGHLLFGLLTGYRFLSFRVGSVMLLKTKNRYTLKRYSLSGTGGQCLMIPPKMKGGAFPFVLYNLGGSISNFLSSAIAIAALFATEPGSIWAFFWLVMVWLGFFTGLTNGIPMRIGNLDNDGKNTLSILKEPSAMRAFWIQMEINHRISLGERLREMPEAWFTMPSEAEMRNSMTSTLAVFACNRILDQGLYTEAAEKIANLLASNSNLSGLHRNVLLCDQLFLELIGENRKEAIDTLYSKEQKRFMTSMKDFPSVLRTLYAYQLLYQKNQACANHTLKKFEKIAKTYPYTGEIQSEWELLKEVNRKMVN